MKHRVYYDDRLGQAALLTAGLRLGILPTDRLPSREQLAAFLRDHGRAHPQGRVVLLGETPQEKVYWCGLGQSAVVAVRAWRHFLQFYQQPQSNFSFYWVPSPKRFRWRRGERLLSRGQQEMGRTMIADAAVREYAVFLTALWSDL